MKKAGLILLVPLIVILLTGFVSADAFGWTANLLGISSATVAAVTVYIIIFLMFAFAFSDIIAGFTAFSTPVAWVIGFGLAVIAALTKVIAMISIWLMAITAGLGVISVAVAIGSAFVAFLLVHLGLGGLTSWVWKRQRDLKAYKNVSKVKTGFRTLKDVGHEAQK